MAPSAKRPLSERDPNVQPSEPQSKPAVKVKEPAAKKSKKSEAHSDLLVLSATSSAIDQFIEMINGRLPEPTATNQSLTPRLRQLTDADLAFPQEVQHGHCVCLLNRSKVKGEVKEEVKLIEGGTNNDSPR
jgi:hypothetical protein